jgi:hypothetical protein
MMRTWQPCLCPCMVHELEKMESNKVFQVKKKGKVDPVRVPEVEAKSNLSSGPVRTPGAVRNKTDAQVAYGVGFGCSIYGWKHNFIELPMAPVSCQNSS